jgi:homocitrate synthase NifV
VRVRTEDGAVALRDVTLREGLDTPGVTFTRSQRIAIARGLAAAGLRELEVVAPSRVRGEVGIAASIRAAGVPVRLSGLVYAFSLTAEQDIAATIGVLDHIDLLMPLAAARAPTGYDAKLQRLLDVLSTALALGAEAGVGFPHATQVDSTLVADFAAAASKAGARRVTIYDTNGSAVPTVVTRLIASVCRAADADVFYHAHNDLGLATANALAAVEGGASGLDVTVNGLGDRAGNASLEQVALALALLAHRTSVTLTELPTLSALLERESGVPVSPLAPVVGRFAARHRSPTHLPQPELFEAYDPSLVGAARAVDGVAATPASPATTHAARSPG